MLHILNTHMIPCYLRVDKGTETGVTKFFPDLIFPRFFSPDFLFPDKVFDLHRVGNL